MEPDDFSPEDDLTEDELREHRRGRRERAASCSDGMCGGCPRCGVPLDEPIRVKRKMGLACLSPERRKEIARLGGLKRTAMLTKKDPA